jgi:hypothetical protein
MIVAWNEAILMNCGIADFRMAATTSERVMVLYESVNTVIEIRMVGSTIEQLL